MIIFFLLLILLFVTLFLLAWLFFAQGVMLLVLRLVKSLLSLMLLRMLTFLLSDHLVHLICYQKTTSTIMLALLLETQFCTQLLVQLLEPVFNCLALLHR